jgi:hypothetical protein
MTGIVASSEHPSASVGRSTSSALSTSSIAAPVLRRHALARERGVGAVPWLPGVSPHLERAHAGRVDAALQDPRIRLGAFLHEVALERHQDRALLFGGEPFGQLEPTLAFVDERHRGTSARAR